LASAEASQPFPCVEITFVLNKIRTMIMGFVARLRGRISPVAMMEKDHFRHRLMAISLSLLLGAALMLLKFYVYWLTQSSAILSDALESIINVVASAFALGSVVLSAKPPDSTHPYGHEKIEYFSAGFEGALIVLAAFGIFWTAWPQIMQPHELPNLGSGLLILLGTSAVNLALGLGLIRVGRRTNSLVLMADGKHVLTDVYTSAGVLVGLVLVRQTGWYWLDGGIACLVAVNILVIGTKLVLQAFAGLMHASDPTLLEEISELIAEHRRPNWIDIHRLRAWRAGNRIQADFHLILPRDLTLDAAHNEVTLLQDILKTHLGGMMEALIHAEPCIEPECPICGYDPCTLRQAPMRHQKLWRREMLTYQVDEEEREVAQDSLDASKGNDKAE
jgi:cation diffusion facilitator family transporter